MTPYSKGICVIDFESLSVDNDAVILSFGIATHPWKPLTDIKDIKSVNFKFNVSEQIVKFGRKATPSTLEWWAKQSPEAKKILTPTKDDISLMDFDAVVRAWFDDVVGNYMWKYDIMDRNSMDTRLVNSLYETEPFKSNWKSGLIKYNAVWEIRTALMLTCGNPYGTVDFPDYPELVAHNSESDCIMDCIRILTAYTEAGILKNE